MKRVMRPEEARLWGVITATVRPVQPRHAPAMAPGPAPVDLGAPAGQLAPVLKPPPKFVKPIKAKGPAPVVAKSTKGPPPSPEAIEPGRKRRIVRERDDLGGRLDLHGLDQDAARAALHRFLQRAQEDGLRAVLVITGKGSLGDGILRKRTPDWLAEAAMRSVVAGISEAHRRHGGSGALYVALKRKP